MQALMTELESRRGKKFATLTAAIALIKVIADWHDDEHLADMLAMLSTLVFHACYIELEVPAAEQEAKDVIAEADLMIQKLSANFEKQFVKHFN